MKKSKFTEAQIAFVQLALITLVLPRSRGSTATLVGG